MSRKPWNEKVLTTITFMTTNSFLEKTFDFIALLCKLYVLVCFLPSMAELSDMENF